MAELVDAPASGAGDRKVVEVRVLFRAPHYTEARPSEADPRIRSRRAWLVGRRCSDVLTAKTAGDGMVHASGSSQRNAFSRWLRTGKVPSALGPDGLERKYNPWHDLADGRFTFAGAGRHDGSSNGDTTNAGNGRTSSHVGRAPRVGSRTAAHPKAKVSQARPLAGVGRRSVEHGSVGMPPARAPVTPPGSQSNPVGEFVGGVARGFTMSGRER